MNDWYGFEHGAKSFQGNQHKKVSAKILHTPDLTNAPSTQKDLAQDYGISHQTMNNYMRLAKAIPELEDLVDTGIVTKTTALAMMQPSPMLWNGCSTFSLADVTYLLFKELP